MENYLTRYTVRIYGIKLEVKTPGTYSAIASAMNILGIAHADKVTVRSGEGEHATYFNVTLVNADTNQIKYDRKES